MQNAQFPSPVYQNCTIRGLPITAPFRIHYDVQGKESQTGTFIILPFQMTVPGSELFDFTDPSELKDKEENLQEEHTNDLEEIDDTSNNASNYFEEELEDGCKIIIKTEPEEFDNKDIPSDIKEEIEQKNYKQNVECEFENSIENTDRHENIRCVQNKKKQPRKKSRNKKESKEHSSAAKNKRKQPKEEDVELEEIQKPKLVKLEEADSEEAEDSRRKSSRLRYAGFRPDYQNVENKIDKVLKYLEGDDITSDVENDDLEEKDIKAYDEDTECENDAVDEDPDFDPQEFSKSKTCARNDDSEVDNESNELIDSNESDDDYTDSDTNSTDGIIPSKVVRKKPKAKKPPKKRIHVNLTEHPDKYKIETLDSIARKDRGKSDSERFVMVYACILCSKYTSESTEGIESHLENHLNGELNCKDCEFSSSSVGEVMLHRAQMHKKDCRICPECGLKVAYGRLKTHFGLIHNNPQYTCSYCVETEGEVKYATHNQLRRHIKECHRDVCIICRSCEKVFLKDDHLRYHKTVCSGRKETSSQCEKCGKEFATDNNLARHVERVHLKIRRYLCTECPFAAKSSSVLRNHQLVHQGVHPFQCDQCSFTCVQGYQLKSHMRTHTGEKPYKCTQCKYAAAWNVQLKEHVKVHGLETAVMCQTCEIMFKNEKTLNLHLKKQKCVL